MKQVKFFLVALMAVVMGMSVTSCMGDGENVQQYRQVMLLELIWLEALRIEME